MIRKMVLGAMVFASSLLAVSPASATIINLTVNPGIGLDVARTCIGSSCLLSGGQVWLNNSNYATTGTITIDDSLMTLSATLNVAFSEITGAADNGITELEFYNTTYTITNAPVTLFGGTFTITGGNWATVDPGTLTQVGAGGGSTDPIFSAVRVTGSCGSLPNGQCGFTFGRVNFQVGAPLNRYVEQTFNLAVVPEPTTITLIGAGILGLGWAGRRRA